MVFGICSEVYVATAGCSKEPTIGLEIDTSARFGRFSRTGVDLGEKAGKGELLGVDPLRFAPAQAGGDGSRGLFP